MKTVKNGLGKHLLTILTIISVVLGIITGIAVRSIFLDKNEKQFSPRVVMYVNFIGDVFLRILKGLILPLVVSSLVAAVGSLDISLSKRIGTRAIVYYVSTTFVAVMFGIILVSVIQPGLSELSSSESDKKVALKKLRDLTTADTMLDLVR
jgi:Na+/H+-dicarboxylate symporter